MHTATSNNSRFFTVWRLACLFVLTLAGLVYLPSLPGIFIWDDVHLASGQGIGGGKSLAACFTKPFLHHYFRPLVSVTFFLENKLWRQTPFFYHQTNILLHVLTTGLLISTLRVAFGRKRIALAGGLAFAVQPVQVSTVAWIGGRTDSLCALWVVCFAYALIRAAQTTGRARLLFLAGSAVAYAGALLTKEQTLALLPLVPLAFRCFSPPDAPNARATAWRMTLPFLAVSVGFLFLWLLWWPQPMQPAPLGWTTQLAMGGRTILYYTLALFAPTPRWMHTLSLGTLELAGIWSVLGGFGIAAVCVALWRRWMRTEPASAWFLALICLTLLPVSNLMPLPSLLVAPYRAGVAGLGAAALLGWAMGAGVQGFRYSGIQVVGGWRREGWRWAAGALFLVWCAGLTVWGAGRWHNARMIFSTIARYDPDSLIARYNLTSELLNANKQAAAIAQLEEILARLFGSSAWKTKEAALAALETNPRIMARTQENQGNQVEPQKWLAQLYARLGHAYLDSDNLPRSRVFFHIGEAIDPTHPDVHLGLGFYAYHVNDRRGAIRHLRLALAALPRQYQAHLLLGRIYAEQGEWEKARAEFAASIAQGPDVGVSYVRLAEAQYRLGDRRGAETTLKTAAQRTPLRDIAQQMVTDLNNNRAPRFDIF